MNINWEKYIQKTAEKPPRPLLIEALAFVSHRGTALDFGAGALMDSKYLVEQGYERVVAVDSDAVSEEYAKQIQDSNFSFVRSTFKDFSLTPTTYDLINAQRSLPFVSREEFNNLIAAIKSSLNTDGIFCAVIFGDRNTLPQTSTLLTREQVEEMLADMEIIKLDETEEDKQSALGTPTHFHEFHIIARKKS